MHVFVARITPTTFPSMPHKCISGSALSRRMLGNVVLILVYSVPTVANAKDAGGSSQIIARGGLAGQSAGKQLFAGLLCNALALKTGRTCAVCVADACMSLVAARL